MTNKTFEEVAAMWLADKQQYVKMSTYCAYSLLLFNHLKPAFAQDRDITEELVQKFVLSKLQQGLSRNSVKDMLMVLKMILKYASKHGYMPARQIDINFPTERRPPQVKTFSRADQKRLMDHIRANFSFMNLGIYICLSAGLRIGELCALTWDDLDTDAGVVRISRTLQRIYNKDKSSTEVIIGTPKSKNSVREIPLAKELQRLIKPLKKVVNGSFYVLTNSSHPTEPRSYRNHYRRLMQQLGLPQLNFHGLRHSFATRCIESKCDYKTVSVLLGHSSISTTLNLYVHPNLDQKKKCIERMFKTLR